MLKIGGTNAYNIEELAENFGMQPATARKLLNKGEIKGFKVGKRWFAEEEEINTFIERQKKRAATE